MPPRWWSLIANQREALKALEFDPLVFLHFSFDKVDFLHYGLIMSVIHLTREDLLRARKETPFENIGVADFKLMLRDVARAHTIIFTDSDGKQKTLKSRKPA